MKKGERMSDEQKIKHSLALMGHATSDKVRKQCGDIWRGRVPPQAFKQREEHPMWKGGVVKKGGYLVELCPWHPYATKAGYVPQHRLVIERHIGRFLKPNEHVHHRDNSKTNNHIDNLELLTEHDHLSLHAKKRPMKLFCKSGHYLHPSNIYMDRGARVCVVCRKKKSLDRYYLKD
ncbi:MAG: HNH endonuclease [Elusimicrobia bacterium]|nr:HNH endonuclease [Elusimicrobiota bacterium]